MIDGNYHKTCWRKDSWLGRTVKRNMWATNSSYIPCLSAMKYSAKRDHKTDQEGSQKWSRGPKGILMASGTFPL